MSVATRQDAVRRFLQAFCEGDVDGLESLLAEDLQFSGPFHHFGSRFAYLESLRGDPPEKCRFRVLSITESGDDVCVFYDYEKAGQTITVAQLCRFKGDLIGEILLVFDSGSMR